MRKSISLLLVLVMLIGLVSCGKKEVIQDDVVLIVEEQSTQSLTSTPEPPKDETKPTYESTIIAPDSIYFYKDGMYGEVKDKEYNLHLAKFVESWHASYQEDTLPFTNLDITEQLVAELKLNETVVEICFDKEQEKIFCGKIKLAQYADRILIPLTGKYAYYVFVGYNQYIYRASYSVNGSGLEKYFENVTIDQKVKDWQSTVIAPTTVTFYKDGKQSVSTDKEFNHTIARHIEEWFKYKTEHAVCLCITFNSDITERKYNTTAIELVFDDEMNFCGGGIPSTERKIFISLDGDHAYQVFFSNDYSETWGNVSTASSNKNLEQFFANRVYEDIQPTNTWKSTVPPPERIQLYKNGEMVNEYTDQEFNYNVAKQIESWFLYEENIKFADTGITDATISTIREKETYIEIRFAHPIKFYDKLLNDEANYYLLIPLSGSYRNFIFASKNADDYTNATDSPYSTRINEFIDYYND